MTVLIRVRALGEWGLLFVLIAGCQTLTPSPPPGAITPAMGQPPLHHAAASRASVRAAGQHTGLAGGAVPRVVNHHLVLPQAVLVQRQVLRPRAEVRDAPKSTAHLQGVLLPRGTWVVVLSRRGQWVQMTEPQRGVTGWVHLASLGPYAFNRQPLSLPLRTLPLIATKHPIGSAVPYGQAHPISVHMRAGTQLPSLRDGHLGRLVWLRDRNALLWLKREDVR